MTILNIRVVAAVTAAVTMPGGGGAPPGTPSAKLKVNIPLIEPSTFAVAGLRKLRIPSN